MFPVALFVFATGFTDCASFESVTVPRADTSSPTVFGGVWLGDRATGDYQLVALGDDGFRFDGDYDDRFVVFAGGEDTGGVRRVTLETDWWMMCREEPFPRIGRHVDVRSQDGGVGDTVSSGVYARRRVERGCPEGRVTAYVATFQATVTNFHGRSTTTPEYTIALQ